MYNALHAVGTLWNSLVTFQHLYYCILKFQMQCLRQCPIHNIVTYMIFFQAIFLRPKSRPFLM